MQSGNYSRDEDLQNLSEHHRGFSLKNHHLICKLKGTEESNNEVGGNNSTQPRYRLEGHAQRCACDSRKQGRWSKMLVAAALRTEHGGHVALLGTLPSLQCMSIHNIIKQFSLQFFSAC